MVKEQHILSVLVTRPDPAGSELCQLINAQGDHAVFLPTIAFAPPSDLVEFQQAVAALGKQDYLIFVSPRAVYESIPAIRRAWPEFPPKVKFVAVGGGTAAALHAAGYQSIYPDVDWHSEGLLDLREFQDPNGKKIAIIRGEGGRELLNDALIDRGASVIHVVAYKRVLPQIEANEYINKLAQRKIDAVIATSYDSVHHLKLLIGEKGWPYLRAMPLIVISDRIKMLARDLDFQTIWVAPNASHQSILQTLAQKRDEIWQIKQAKA